MWGSDWLPCWLPRGQQVSHQRWISGNVYYIHLLQVWIRLPTLALKPRGDITRSPKQGNQWPHKKDLCPPKIKKKSTLRDGSDTLWRSNGWWLYAMSVGNLCKLQPSLSLLEQECVPVGCAPSAALAISRGCLLKGVSVLGDVCRECLPGGSTQWGVCPGGVSAWGGICPGSITMLQLRCGR